MLKKYFKPKSLTWWTGVASIVYGILNNSLEAIAAGVGAVGLRGAVGEKKD